VTIRTEDMELFSGSIPGTWESLRKLLDRYRSQETQVVYEAGYFGYWLHDHLVEYGVDSVVTPPTGRWNKAYVGLTPSQYSNGEKVRMGRITGVGKNALRGTLVEAAWRLIGKDPAMREKYDRIKARTGSKRAIIAVARITVLRTRRMLLDRRPYAVGLAA
jgi:hypothetical protein